MDDGSSSSSGGAGPGSRDLVTLIVLLSFNGNNYYASFVLPFWFIVLMSEFKPVLLTLQTRSLAVEVRFQLVVGNSDSLILHTF
jgi:hypothetical protein